MPSADGFTILGTGSVGEKRGKCVCGNDKREAPHNYAKGKAKAKESSMRKEKDLYKHLKEI